MNALNYTLDMGGYDDANIYPDTTIGKVFTLIAMVLLSGCSTFGNILVFVAFVKVKSLQRTTNYFILSVAAADLIVGFFVINIYTFYVVMDVWPFSTLDYNFCVFWLTIDYSSFQASVLSVLLVTGDRYLSIKHPHSYRIKRSDRRVKYAIAISWLVAFVLWTPLIISYAYVDGIYEEAILTEKCDIGSRHNVIATVFVFVVSYILPIVVTGYFAIHSMYLLLNIKHRKNTKVNHLGTIVEEYAHNVIGDTAIFQNPGADGFVSGRKTAQVRDTAVDRSIPGPSNNQLNIQCCAKEDMFVQSHEKRKVVSVCEQSPSMIRREMADAQDSTKVVSKTRSVTLSVLTYDMNIKPVIDRSFYRIKQFKANLNRFERLATFKMIIAIAFIVNVFPFAAISIIRSLCSTCITKSWWHFGYLMSYLNTVVNPICYAIGNKKFKRAFKSILCCKSRQINV